MKEISKFFIENWRLILEIALVCCSAVVFMLRKKPVTVVDTLKEIIVRSLPALINLAELQVGLSGDDKLSFVIAQLKMALSDLGYSDEIITRYTPFATEQVEMILSTPQKKSGRKD